MMFSFLRPDFVVQSSGVLPKQDPVRELNVSTPVKSDNSTNMLW